jgi:hypothetical protein
VNQQVMAIVCCFENGRYDGFNLRTELDWQESLEEVAKRHFTHQPACTVGAECCDSSFIASQQTSWKSTGTRSSTHVVMPASSSSSISCAAELFSFFICSSYSACSFLASRTGSSSV